MNLSEFTQHVSEENERKGFRSALHNDDVNIMVMEYVALLHGEVSEFMEEARSGHKPTDVYYRSDGKPEGMPMEAADIFIRLIDMCGALGIDLEKAVEEKDAYNGKRPYLHGKEF